MSDLMLKPDLNLAIVQGPMVWQDIPANLAYYAKLLMPLAQQPKVDLIVLPEMFNTGFSMDSAKLAEPVDGLTTQWLQQQAANYNAVICGSFIVKVAENDYRNRLLWVEPNGTYQLYDKRHLFRMAGEHQYFTPGSQQLTVELNGWRIRPLICYDLRFPVWSRDPETTDLLIYVANWPAARRNAWNRLLPARAIENLCYLAATNRTGQDDKGYPYSGDSQVLDFMGEPLVQANAQDGVFVTTLSAQKLADFKQKFPAYLDADTFSLE